MPRYYGFSVERYRLVDQVFKPIRKGLKTLGWAGLEPATFALKGRWH